MFSSFIPAVTEKISNCHDTEYIPELKLVKWTFVEEILSMN